MVEGRGTRGGAAENGTGEGGSAARMARSCIAACESGCLRVARRANWRAMALLREHYVVLLEEGGGRSSL